MNTKETLEKLEELFSDKSRWTTEEAAKNANGDPVRPHASDAVSFCLLGGLERVDREDYCYAADFLRDVAQKEYKTRLLTQVNDDMGYDAVMKLIRTAKEKAE